MEEFLQQKDPIVILEQWLEDAKSTNLRNPNAFVVSTVANGQPSSRVVLVKEIKNDAIVFYTNYLSRKGREIADNPLAAANFHWDALGRQICICGSLAKNSREESVVYWNSRPRESRIAQYVSHQSEAVPDRDTLEDLFREAEQKFAEKDIPCPEHWGGYLLSITEIEFWIADPRRFHDRFQYIKREGTWFGQRLSP